MRWAAVLALALAAAAEAATRTWSGTTGNWEDAACWGGTVPQDGDAAVVNSGSILLSGTTSNLTSFTMGGGTLTFTNWTTAVFRECVAEQCKDATDCLASAKWSFRVAIEAADILGADPERVAVWQERLRHLAPYPVMEDPVCGPMLADGINAQGQPFLGMGKELVVSLADDITLDSSDAEKALVLNFLRSQEDRLLRPVPEQ